MVGLRGAPIETVENEPSTLIKVSWDEGILHYHSFVVWHVELVLEVA